MSCPDPLPTAEELLAALPDRLLHLAADGRLLASYGGEELADVTLAVDRLADQTNRRWVVAEDDSRLIEAHCTALADGSRLCLLRDIGRHRPDWPHLGITSGIDPLTGLPTKQRLWELIDDEIGRSQRARQPLALIHIALEGLTNVTERFGQQIATLMLQWAMGRLRTTLRATDQLGWHGLPAGSEPVADGGFVLLLPALTQPEDALIVAERSVELLQRPFTFDGQTLTLSARAGIALSPIDGQGAQSLWHQATAACHLAARGGPRCRYADPKLDDAARQRLTLAGELRAALADQALTVVYQPRIERGRVVAVEALVRWPTDQGKR